MEFVSGSIFIRPNDLSRPGARVDGHIHQFDHTTFCRKGWMLVRRVKPDGAEYIQQIASPEYAGLRAMQLKYEPETVLRPVRFADDVDGDGRKHFVLEFIKQGEAVPDGAEEIPFAPGVHYHLLIDAEVTHELAALAPAIFDCTYSHRTPQGDVVQYVTGWSDAYC